MSPDLQRLVTLQDVDSAIAAARRTIAAHPERLAEADARLAEAAAARDAVQARLAASQEERRVKEKDAAVYQGRLAKFKDQLSAVKTNREYQAMQHEIETAQKELDAAEERVLERMMEADGLASEVKAAEAAFAARKAEHDAERKALDAELATVEQSLQQALARRTELIAQIDPLLVATFEQVARVRKGVAVTTATRDGLCAVCHVRLRPAVFQLVRHNDSIIQCDSCQRILYFVPPPPPAEGAIVR